MLVTGPIAPVVRLAGQYDLVDFVSREPSLEEVFLSEYGTAAGAGRDDRPMTHRRAAGRRDRPSRSDAAACSAACSASARSSARPSGTAAGPRSSLGRASRR